MLTVLLADDDAILRDMYTMRLTRAGFEVHGVMNGQEAVEEAKQIHPDIILLDVMMPKMNGLDALKLIKSDPDTGHIPVVLLTAMVQDLSQVADVIKSAEKYLVKSEIIPDQLVKTVQEILAKKNPPTATVSNSTT